VPQTTPNITGDILLEAGTNELEVLVFQLGIGHYGVNVAKVREVIRSQSTVATPGQHPSVVGMFNIRGSVIPVVDLARHLAIPSGAGDKAGERRVIITEFNGIRTGFIVDSVEQIYRMSWSKVRSTPDLQGLSGAHSAQTLSSTTGIVEIKDRLVMMIDFESVADAILMHDKLRVQPVPNEQAVPRAGARVVLAEDSPFMRSVIERVFRLSGYTDLVVVDNGEAAWNALQAGPVPGAIVSDIEMPRMDGLALCKRIKSDPRLRDCPVILFSSLVSADNINKGQQVGADVQIPKPELPEMVRLVDQAITGKLKPATRQAA
jgi:two-component system chemotaxis response regulator CheV